jgi:transmembrane sensor
VAVSQETSAEATMVSKGEEVSVGAEEKGKPPLAVAVQAVPVEVISERLSWRIPRFEFTGTSLDEVAAMFNRHNQHQLILNDPALGHLRLSGILRADNLPALVKMLETQFHVAVEYRGANEIVLRTRP